jgi:MOSC domain-containing protein YiiM
VYAYAREDLDWWQRERGYELPPGRFGENLTTQGLDLTNTLVGERWRIGGTVVLPATSPRIPCATFAHRMGEPKWVKRFAARGATGTYLRVVVPGEIKAGDRIEVIRPGPHHQPRFRETCPAGEQALRDDRLVHEDVRLKVLRRELSAEQGTFLPNLRGAGIEWDKGAFSRLELAAGQGGCHGTSRGSLQSQGLSRQGAQPGRYGPWPVARGAGPRLRTLSKALKGRDGTPRRVRRASAR